MPQPAPTLTSGTTAGSSYTARVEHLDDYHFDLGEYGNVYHICQFGEMMERTGSTAYPEIQTQDEQGAWELGGKGYLAIQSCEDGWDYTLYHSDYSVMDGGQIDAPGLIIATCGRRTYTLSLNYVIMVYHFPLFAVSKHFSTFFQKRLGKDLFLW